MISGRRVDILTRNGIIRELTGKRAIHLMTPEDRKRVPELHQMWIDIGAKSKEEALERNNWGCSRLHPWVGKLNGSLIVSRAFDDKRKYAYAVNEATSFERTRS